MLVGVFYSDYFVQDDSAIVQSPHHPYIISFIPLDEKPLDYPPLILGPPISFFLNEYFPEPDYHLDEQNHLHYQSSPLYLHPDITLFDPILDWNYLFPVSIPMDFPDWYLHDMIHFLYPELYLIQGRHRIYAYSSTPHSPVEWDPHLFPPTTSKWYQYHLSLIQRDDTLLQPQLEIPSDLNLFHLHLTYDFPTKLDLFQFLNRLGSTYYRYTEEFKIYVLPWKIHLVYQTPNLIRYLSVKNNYQTEGIHDRLSYFDQISQKKYLLIGNSEKPDSENE